MCLKGNWGKSFTPVFMSNFCYLYWVRALCKVLWRSEEIRRIYKATKLCIQRMWRHTSEYIKHVTPDFFGIFCTFYGESTSIINFCGVSDLFSRTCEVANSGTIKLSWRKWRHTRKRTNKIYWLWLTCKLLEFFVNVILFYDEKGSL